MREKTTSAKGKQRFTNAVVHIFLTALSIVWLFPVFWIILLSFRVQKGQYIDSFWPKEFTLANYQKLFFETDVFNFPRWFGNTLLISVFSCLISTFFVLAVSYGMSRLRFKLRRPFLNVALVLGMFPGFFSMIAVYYILKALGLTEGPRIYIALVMAYSGTAGLGFYISKGFFDTIPKALDEAAMIDGATKWEIFTKVTIPLSKPIVVFTLLSAFMGPWLDFVFAKVIIGPSQDYYTVAVGLYTMLAKENIINWYAPFAAGAVCISIPIAALFLYLQSFYAEGMSGAVKG